MKLTKTALALLIVFAASATGYVAGYYSKATNEEKAAHVTGIGGVFFRSKNPKELKQWYDTHLGFNSDKYGTYFEWREGSDSSHKGFTLWAPFHEKTTYFTKDMMINYRVNDLNLLLQQLKAEGINPIDTVELTTYGKFAHIIDPEGNKIELWQPDDTEYEKLTAGRTIY